MSNLELRGKTILAGKEIPEIAGGFGENKKSMLAKDIAQFHNKELRYVNKLINNHIEKFRKEVDIIDLKEKQFAVHLVNSGILTQGSVNASKNIYLLSERGYAKLIKIFDDDLSWRRYDYLLDEYFEIREEKKNSQPQSIEDLIIMQAKSMKEMREKVDKVEDQVASVENKMNKEVERIASKVDTFVTHEDVIASDIARLLNLRSERGIAHNNLIGAIAKKLGFKINYKHNYQDKYIKVVQDEDGRGFRTYYRPAGVDKIVEWFENNKDTIYYRKVYKRSGRWGKEGDLKEHGYVVNGVHYKIQK